MYNAHRGTTEYAQCDLRENGVLSRTTLVASIVVLDADRDELEREGAFAFIVGSKLYGFNSLKFQPGMVCSSSDISAKYWRSAPSMKSGYS